MLGIEIAQPTVARYGKFPETALTGSRRSSQSAARIAFIRIYSGLDHAVQASLRSNAFFPVGLSSQSKTVVDATPHGAASVRAYLAAAQHT